MCYQQHGDYEVNIACLKSDNATAIKSHCGLQPNPPLTPYNSEICPEKATAKIPYKQCYNTLAITGEQYVKNVTH